MKNSSATVPAPHPDIRYDLEFSRFTQLFEKHHRKFEISLSSDFDNIPAFNNGIVYLLDKDDLGLFLDNNEMNGLELVGNGIIEIALRMISGKRKLVDISQFNYINTGRTRRFNFCFHNMFVEITNSGTGHWVQVYDLKISKK